ncbi:MAG TPA: hypothetical protein VMU08_14350 [Rhizomicrobium sp.]|nr:hypothetical protein [Rhizomicrobium sp.]
MPDFSSELSASPSLYAQKYDSGRDAILFVRMTPEDYRAASFLDDRMLLPGTQGIWAPHAQVEAALATAAGRPLHYIFHTGHVGSTLLSRLIDETGTVLGLREPLPLRTLAELGDMVGNSAERERQLAARLATFLKLWRRGFAETRSVVLKATSSAGRLAPRLLTAAPAAQAVYLNLRAEPYLATLLGGANAITDLRGFEQERSNRVRTALGDDTWRSTSLGELAAMSWLAESLTRQTAVEQFEARVLPLDFDQMLSDLPTAFARILRHLDIEAPPGLAAAIARSPILTRYSKAPKEFAYSPAMRAQLLAQARRENFHEIRRGLQFLERLGARHAKVAALL